MTIYPIFHYFNITDNIVVMMSGLSISSAFVMRGLAKTELVYYLSTGLGMMRNMFFAAIRAQMSRCITSEDLGKVR